MRFLSPLRGSHEVTSISLDTNYKTGRDSLLKKKYETMIVLRLIY